MNCPACGNTEQRRSGDRCSGCEWQFDGPLARLLAEVQKVAQGGEADACLSVIEPQFQPAKLSPEAGRIISKLINAGNPERAARLIIEEGQRRKRDWRGASAALLAGIGTLLVFSTLYYFVGVPTPMGPPFSFVFISLGALFCGLSVTGFSNPAGITVGNLSASQLSPQQWMTARAATKGEGRSWAVVMLAAGLGMSGFGVFAGAIL